MAAHVLVSDPDQWDVERAAGVLAGFLGVPAIDARRLAKRGWGFLGEKLEPARAEALAARAGEAGLSAVVVADADLKPLPGAEPVHMARCAPESFFFAAGSQSTETPLPWAAVRVGAAVGLREETTVTKTVSEGPSGGAQLLRLGLTLATGIPMGLGKSKKVQVTKKEGDLFFSLDVFTNGPDRRLHINARDFNFAALGARRRASALDNFHLLLEDIAAHAPEALCNRGAQAILARRSLVNLYDAREDYEKECLWLWNIARRP